MVRIIFSSINERRIVRALVQPNPPSSAIAHFRPLVRTVFFLTRVRKFSGFRSLKTCEIGHKPTTK